MRFLHSRTLCRSCSALHSSKPKPCLHLLCLLPHFPFILKAALLGLLCHSPTETAEAKVTGDLHVAIPNGLSPSPFHSIHSVTLSTRPQAFSWFLSWHCWLLLHLICFLFPLILDVGKALRSVLSYLLSFCTFSLGISFIPQASHAHADNPHMHISGLDLFPELQIQYPTALTISAWKSNRNSKPIDPG